MACVAILSAQLFSDARMSLISDASLLLDYCNVVVAALLIVGNAMGSNYRRSPRWYLGL